MKLITINVEDEEHTAIKLAATKAGLSIKDYLLGKHDKSVVIFHTPDKALSAAPEWSGPLFRDKKKSKLWLSMISSELSGRLTY